MAKRAGARSLAVIPSVTAGWQRDAVTAPRLPRRSAPLGTGWAGGKRASEQASMAPPGGKINRPKTELSKRLFKRRRVLGRHKKKKKNGNAGVVPDRGLVTVRRLEMRNAAVTLSGKKRRKLLKRLRRLRNDKVGTEGSQADYGQNQVWNFVMMWFKNRQIFKNPVNIDDKKSNRSWTKEIQRIERTKPKMGHLRGTSELLLLLLLLLLPLLLLPRVTKTGRCRLAPIRLASSWRAGDGTAVDTNGARDRQICERRTAMTRALLSTLVLALALASARSRSERCYSRQHRNVEVDGRAAAGAPGAASDSRALASEQDCVLTCCSLEMRPGAKCNVAVFDGNKRGGEDNCFLYHCPDERDCPLKKSPVGACTYDIFKGSIHPSAGRPAAATPAAGGAPSLANATATAASAKRGEKTAKKQSKTKGNKKSKSRPADAGPRIASELPVSVGSLRTSAAAAAVTSSAAAVTPPAAAVTPPAAATSTQFPRTAMSPTSTPTPPMSATTPLTATGPPRTAAPLKNRTLMTTTMTTTSPKITAWTTTIRSTTPPPATWLPMTPPPTTPPPVTPPPATLPPATPPPVTPPPATLPPATPPPATPPPATPPPATLPPATPTESALTASEAGARDGVLRNTSAKTKPGGPKSGAVAFLVVGAAVLTLALAAAGRKAAESFDRRHYTRLELNDLHYDL
ncbi:MANSC domain-containing protein 1 isoform X2 [Corythoichthys intestinalis]|uniref:MANSC domain-containing protein 1 isoform X2 n=1 Tax=Corythoichthys intestinalis TaxID=161448 RepID=UPI0025A6221F|nr:MANSC domain-containing protein 1 isoform X2 [Corythoichthys intestinalis]